MHKCPKCGAEFEETPFATIIVDPNMPKDKWFLAGAPLFTAWGQSIQYEGTCLACMRGDCELARKGIPHT